MPLLAKTKASARKALEQRRRAMSAANPVTLPLSGYRARHVDFAVDGKVATLTLNRPDKKNPLTFDSYAEIVDLFRAAAQGQGREGHRRHRRGRQLLLRRRRVRDHRAADQDEHGRAARLHPHDRRGGQGDARCPAADRRRDRRRLRRRRRDHRHGLRHPHRHRRRRKVAFLFNRVGLAGCDMGACAILPRIVGQGRAAELLFTGRSMGGEEAERMGFFNRLADVRDRAGRGARSSRTISPTGRPSATP